MYFFCPSILLSIVLTANAQWCEALTMNLVVLFDAKKSGEEPKGSQGRNLMVRSQTKIHYHS